MTRPIRQKRLPSRSIQSVVYPAAIAIGKRQVEVENALKHGNKYDCSKNVTLSYFETDDGWGVLVRDEGAGFDPADLLDPEADEALYRENGRGLFILKKFMDTLEYFDEGRTAFLFKSNA